MAAVQEVDFVVAGCGVVGTACALVLAQAGFKVAVVGKRLPAFVPSAGQEYDPRVFAITAASQRLLAGLKVWDKLPAERVQPVKDMQICAGGMAGGSVKGSVKGSVSRVAADVLGASMLHFNAADAGVEQLTWIVEQSVLFEGLFQAVQYHPNIVLFNSNAMAFHEAVAPACVTVLNIDGQTLNAAVVVNATGASGAVLSANNPAHGDVNAAAKPEHLDTALGLFNPLKHYDYRAVVCHLAIEKPHFGVARQWFMDGFVLALLPMPSQRVSLVWSMPNAKAKIITQAGEPVIELLRQLEALPQVVEAVGAMQPVGGVFDFALRHGVAPCWTKPGAMLVGDAAHVVHPLAGQGLNLGLEDVEHLAQAMSQSQSELRTIVHDLRSHKAHAVDALQHWPVWSRWARQRKAACMQVYGLTHVLHHGVATVAPALNSVVGIGLGFGFKVLNAMPMTKRFLIRQAMR